MDDITKTLTVAEQLADLLFTMEEIKKIIEAEKYVNPEFQKQLYEAFEKGKFTRMIKLRKSLLQLAENGSHPALEKSFILYDKLNASDV